MCMYVAILAGYISLQVVLKQFNDHDVLMENLLNLMYISSILFTMH